MATKSFKDICIEYATQLGKGLPLTPAEMCNAVIMYLNQQVDTMNQAISDFEDEIGDSKYIAKLNGNNVFTQDNSFNLSADAHIFTVKNRLNLDPGEVYINNSNNCVQFQSKDGTLALTSDIPDIPEPTTSDNGKVIGVQSGAYTLVEQSGGEAPDNMVTTDTAQTITAQKTFALSSGFLGCAIRVNRENSDSFTCLLNDGFYIWNNNFAVGIRAPKLSEFINVSFQAKSGKISLTNDFIEFSGVTYSAEDGANIAYGNNHIVLPIIAGDNVTIDTDATNTHLVISASGGAPSNTKYFTRVICHDVNNDTQYIFSCITEGDLSGNNVYGDVVSLLTELGAINSSTMLPCSGKTSAGGVVIGVYTDGSAITVISGDNATEEIPTSAEINIISK